MLKKRVISVLQFAFFLSLGVFLLWLSTHSFSENEIGEVKNLIFSSNLGVVSLCLVILIMSHYIRALRWKSMIDPLGVNPKMTNVFLTVLVGYFMNLIFPRLGEVMKCTLLGKYEKIPADKLIGTIVAERVIDLICLFIVIITTILTQLDIVGEYAKDSFILLVSKYNPSPLSILIIFLTCALTIFIFRFVLTRSKGRGLAGKIGSLIHGIFEGIVSIKHVKNRSKFIIYTFFIWFLYFLSIRIGFLAMTDLNGLNNLAALTILTFGSFAMILTQGGIGAYQLIVQKTLTLYHISEVSGLAFGWLLWSVQTLMLLAVGPLSIIAIFYINKHRKKSGYA